MNAEQALVISVINEFMSLLEFIQVNNFDNDDFFQDDQSLTILLLKRGCLNKFKADLDSLCEDNEIMMQEIKSYLEKEIL